MIANWWQIMQSMPKCQIMWYRIMPYRAISVMSYHIISCHIVSYQICRDTSCDVMSHHAMSCHVMSHHVIYHVISCPVKSCHIIFDARMMPKWYQDDLKMIRRWTKNDNQLRSPLHPVVYLDNLFVSHINFRVNAFRPQYCSHDVLAAQHQLAAVAALVV